MIPIRITFVCLALLVGSSEGCNLNRSTSAAERTSNLTPGMVKLKIERGKTMQAEILETFGPPDQVTHRDGKQIWTYDKISYSTRSDAGTLIFYTAASTVSQSVSTLLILYFDENDRVYEYRLDTYRF